LCVCFVDGANLPDICPSRTIISLSAYAAIEGSCVTIIAILGQNASEAAKKGSKSQSMELLRLGLVLIQL